MSGKRINGHEPRGGKTISRQTRRRLTSWFESGLITKEQLNLALAAENFRTGLIHTAANKNKREQVKELGYNRYWGLKTKTFTGDGETSATKPINSQPTFKPPALKFLKLCGI